MTTRKEQWEALIIEYSHWTRFRVIDPVHGKYKVVLDEEDLKSIDSEILSSFESLGGFDMHPDSLDRFNHPLARFYYLFYTERGMKDVNQVFSSASSGIPGYADGVGALFIDQVIRYMIFVDYDYFDAYRFGQLICSVAVFRNTFDDNIKKFIEKGLMGSRKRFFKVTNTVIDSRKFIERSLDQPTPEKYIPLDSYGIPADYNQDIANDIISNYRSDDPLVVKEFLNVEEYGRFNMEGISLTTPLKVNKSVYSMIRKFVLHVMHLLVNLVEPLQTTLDIVYDGTADPSCFNSLREVIPNNCNFVQGIDKINTDNYTIVILDDENDKEAGSSAGDDSKLILQNSIVRGIFNSFKNGSKLLGISMNLRIPNVIDGSGIFTFCPGDIYLTPWKNPSDDRMRLVWSPRFLNTNVVNYDVKMLDSARKYQDYVVRNLYNFREEYLNEKYTPIGLIDGEFDSELERFIVSKYYEKFPEGQQLWNSVADTDTNIIVPPRYIGDKTFETSVKDLQRYFDFIIKYHTDIPSNPMLVHASRCARGGMFCVGDLLKSPLTESIELIFGKEQDQAIQTFELYERISDEMDNVIRIIEEKRLFRGFRKDLTLLIDLIKELTKNFKEILKREPIVHYGDNYEYQVFGDLRSNSTVMIIQLGDTFGTIMNDLNERLSSRNIMIGNIVYEGTFSLEDPAKSIFTDFIPPMTRVKNVYDIKPIIEKASVPFIVIRGVGYPNEIYDSFINSWSKTELFRGSLEVSESLDVITKLPVKKVSRTEKFNNLISTILVSNINDGIKQDYRSCLFIGSDMENSLDYISGIKCSRVFHLVESGFGGKKVTEMTKMSKRISHRVFVNEDLYESFVLPIDMTFEIIICHPVTFSRFMKTRTSFSNFMKEVSKGFGNETVFSTVDLSGLIDYCSRNSSQDYSYGMYFTNNYFTMTIGNETFTLNGKQGFITEELSKYRDIVKHSGLYYSYKQTGELRTYDRYDDNEDEEDSYDSNLSLNIVRDMLYGINIHKVKVADVQEAYQAYEANVIDVGKGVREYNNLVKREIINSVDKRTRILDLACGHGQDISKWFGDESIDMYIGMDGSQKEISEADSRLRSRRGFKPRNTKFLVRDLFGNQGWTFDAQEFLKGTDRYNVISCQLAIHYAFIDERTIKRFMYNVSNLLEIGGEFIVTTLDDSVIKTLVDTESNELNSIDKITIEGEYYKITMPQLSLISLKSSEVVPPGVSYDFTQFPSDPMARTSTEYIVDSRYFKSLAADMGMELVSSENFTNVDSLKEDARKLDREELKVIAFYKTYKFRKIADAKFGMTIYETPMFKYTDSKIQFDKTLEIINKNIAENTLNSTKFNTGLFLNPEVLFPAPYINQEYEKINVLVEDVNLVRTVAKQMQLKGRITDKENILVNRLPGNVLYDFIYTPYNISNHKNIENVISKLSEKGVVYGTYVDLDRIDSLTTPTGSEFSNYIFGIIVDRQKMLFSINNPVEVESYDIFDKTKMKEVLDKYNMELTLVDLQISNFESLNHNQKQYVGLFGLYMISKKQMEVVEMKAPQVPVSVEDELSGMMETLTTDESVDKFVLLPGLVQKKAPGKGRDETLSSTTSARLYKDLGADSRWRFKLSDDWESREFAIRMPSGEEFESVTRALIYYKCEFSEEPNQEYKGLNLASGLPQPVDIKPFTKAIRGKKGTEWKQREQTVLKKIYEAKFTNTPNVINDDPENLSPLQALLLTRNAQLYSNSKTRNELLENVRNTLKNIVNV